MSSLHAGVDSEICLLVTLFESLCRTTHHRIAANILEPVLEHSCQYRIQVFTTRSVGDLLCEVNSVRLDQRQTGTQKDGQIIRSLACVKPTMGTALRTHLTNCTSILWPCDLLLVMSPLLNSEGSTEASPLLAETQLDTSKANCFQK